MFALRCGIQISIDIRTNNAVEGWNPTLNSTTGKQPPSVFLKKQTWYLGSWNQRNLDSLVKTKKDVCKKYERIGKLWKSTISQTTCTNV